MAGRQPGAASAARNGGGRLRDRPAGQRETAPDRARQGRRLRAGGRADHRIRRDHRGAVPADVDGEGPAARRPPAVGGDRPIAGPEAGRRGDARRCTPELAARTWRCAAVESGRQVHSGRHRRRRDGQQPAHRRSARRRHRLGDGGPPRAGQARADHGPERVARRARRPSRRRTSPRCRADSRRR